MSQKRKRLNKAKKTLQKNIEMWFNKILYADSLAASGGGGLL